MQDSFEYIKKNILKLLEEQISKKLPLYGSITAFTTFSADLLHIFQAEAGFIPTRKALVESNKKYHSGKISLHTHQKDIGVYGAQIRKKNFYLRKSVRDIIDRFDPTLESRKKDELIDKICDFIIKKQKSELRSQLLRRT